MSPSSLPTPAAIVAAADARGGTPVVTFTQARTLVRLLNRRQWKRAAAAAARMGLVLVRRGGRSAYSPCRTAPRSPRTLARGGTMPTSKPLPSTVDNRANERKALAAARRHVGKRKGVCVFFEHGHWWAKYDDGEYTHCFDVVDTPDGFALEEI